MTEQATSRLHRPTQILLVEDNYGDVLLTQEACEKSRTAIALSVASDGEEALAMMRCEGPYVGLPPTDLVLLDLNLPRMDGRDVLKAIKDDPSLRRIPVIVLTSSKAEVDIFDSYELKANSYIVKPVGFERLQEVVDSLQSFWLDVATLSTALGG